MVKRSVILAAAVLMLAGAPLAQQEDDGIFVDEVKKEFLEKVARYVEAKDWKGVFDCYAVALTKYRSKLVRPDPAASSWCSVVEHLNLEFGKLPADAFEYYRIENDGRARAVYEQAVKNDDRRALEGIVDGFFFSSVTDEVLDTLGNRYFEEGRPQVAVHFWRKLLEQYPDSDIPRPVTAARIATAARAWGNERVLDDLKRIVAKRGIEGELRAGGRRMPLSEFLRDITIPQAVAAKEFAELPTIPEGAGRFERKGVGVRNEVKRWSFDLSEAVQAPGRGRPRINPNLPQATLRPEFPYLPSYVRLGNREMILVTHGQRVYAVDPTRAALEEDKKEACFYWRYPSKSEAPIKRGGLDSNLAGYFSTTMPYFGVTVEGDIGFATLYSEKKIPEGGPNNQDVFQGSCRLRAFKLLDGEEVWDTDREELHALYRKLEFYDRNWSFSGPPLVKGDRLYAGICTSPIGESESRVVCIDRRTGEPLWVTFLGSVPNRGNPFFSGGGRFVTYLTMLTEEGGVLYAHTNIGIVAALHSVTGHVLWLSKYPRLAGRGEQIARGEVMPEIRPANPVLLHRGRVYVLPQDQMEWQVFDMTTGERLQVPVPRRVEAEIQWRNIQQMLGIVDDWMILGGAESHVVNLVDRLNEKGEVRTPVYRAHSMVSSNVSKCGRGIIVDEMVYLPTCGDAVGALHIYQGIGSWRIVDQTKWQEPNEYGNLLVAGDYLVVTTQAKVLIYTDEATIDREFAHRLAQSPPNPAAFLEHGDIMGLNERLSKAAESYLAFVRAAEGDPQWEHKVREVKIKLHGIFMRRGDEAAASTDPHVQQRAIEDFTMAQQFAHDENTLADATRRLAESYERLASAQKGTAEGKTFARKAVEEYQKIIEKSRDSYHKPDSGDLIQKMWAYAGERIRELKKDFGDDVYEPVEEAAREALAQVKEGSAEALRKVTELYPDTKAARQAWDRLVEQLEKEGDFKKLLSALREMKERFPEKKAELQRKIWEALEGLFDFRRLLLELECAAAESGDERIRVGEQDMTVREYAVKRLEEIRPRLEASSSGAVGPLRLIATFEPSAGRVRSPYELPMDLAPVQVLGWAPVDLPADREFFTRGSSVELWSVTERRKIWTGVHPGGWLGVTYQDLKGGAESGVVLKEVFVDSPAEAAGLKVGDVVLQMNGRLVGADSFDALLADAGAGGKARLLTRRGRQSRAVDVTLGSWPAEMRPTIVGAAFTRGYQIAVVWEDAVAAFDAATGRPAWTFRAIRDRFGIARLGAVDGRLFIHEHFRGVDRARSPFRLLSNQMQQERGLLSEKEAYSRLLCLNDDTGEVRWARSFAFDAGAAANHSVEIYADGASDALALLSKAYRANVAVWELQLVAGESGQLWKRILLGNGVTAYVVEERRGILFTVDLSNTRTLRGMKLWGSDAEKGAVVLEVPLQGKYMEQSLHGCGLQARGDWLAVVLPPVQPPHARSGAPAGANGKIVVFSVKTGKEHAVVPLAEGRALPTGRATLVNFDADDVLYVYSIPASKPVPAAGERRAYLAAYRLGDGEDSCALLWESIAPFVAPGSGFLAEIVPAGGSVLLHAQRASLPRDGSERYVAAFYDEGAGGYLQVVVDDVTVGREGPEGAGNSVIVQRGRVCLQTARGLQVYGDREP